MAVRLKGSDSSWLLGGQFGRACCAGRGRSWISVAAATRPVLGSLPEASTDLMGV